MADERDTYEHDTYEHDIALCLAGAVGAGGVDEAALDGALDRCRPALDAVRRAHEAGAWPWLSLPERGDDIARLEPLVDRLRGEYSGLVVLGTGGSSLGGRALCALAPPSRRAGVRFCDNLDARGFAETMSGADPGRTLFLAISKSGATAETLAQLAVAHEAVRTAHGDEAARRAFLALSAPGDTPLRRLAARRGIETLDHDPALGGRYSVLSPVGLLPAMFAGVDARALRAGAARVLRRTLGAASPGAAAPALGAALQAAFAESPGAAISAVVVYSDRLDAFSAWFCQLWAESLGKDGKGTTPVAALGPRDQHSQLQLWRDGPADKLFTLITPETRGAGPRVPAAAADPGLAWLAGAALGDLVQAMGGATGESLAAAGRPVRRIRLAGLDERRLGALLMHFMLETAIAGHLLGVNPFDQPAVEHGKRLARRRLAGCAEPVS